MDDEHPPRQRYLTLIAALLGWGLDGVEMGVFPVIARPALIDLLGATNDHIIRQWNAGLAVAFLLGAALGGVLFGRLGDRIGRVRALALSVLVYAGLTGIAALAQSPWQLALARFLAATGMGGEWALGVALVVETWPERARPWLAGLIGAAVNVGYVAVALLAGYLDPTRWRLILGCCAAPAVLTFVVRWCVPESPRWLAARASEPRGRFGELFRGPLLWPTVAGATAAGLYILAVWGAVQFTQLWAAQYAGHDAVAIDVQLTSAAAATVGALVLPPLLASQSRRSSYGVLCLMAFLMAEWLFNSRPFLPIVAALGFFTGGLGGWFALYLPELFPTRLRATGQGFCYNSGRVFAAIGVALTGGLMPRPSDWLDRGDYGQVGAVVSLAFFVGFIFSNWIPETRGRRIE